MLCFMNGNLYTLWAISVACDTTSCDIIGDFESKNTPQLTVSWAVAVLGGDVITDAPDAATISWLLPFAPLVPYYVQLKYHVALTMLPTIHVSTFSLLELICSVVLSLRLLMP